ncbi:hypothetical protein BJX64DRAFT_267025 [Aspergillus heterothallicus]
MAGLEYDSEGEELSETIAQVKLLYDSDVPFFTKARIREAYDSLRANNEPGKRAYVRRLDGKLESFKIKAGEVFRYADEEDKEWIGYPAFYYVSMQALLLDRSWTGSRSPYSNLRIVHRLERTRNGAPEEPPQHVVKASLDRALATFRGSESWAHLKTSLARCNLTQVKKIVAFALAPMKVFSNEDAYANRSAFQHALLITLQEFVLSNMPQDGHHEIRCYAQEPDYTEHDTAVLASHGITVLPDPEAFLEVDDESIVISISPNVPVKQVVCEISRPVLIIWNTVTGDGVEERCTDPDSPRLHKWIREYYEAIDFPHDEDLFGRVSVYVRRT